MRKEKLEKGMKQFNGFKNLLSIDPVVHDDTEKHVHTTELSDMLVLEICMEVYRFVQYPLCGGYTYSIDPFTTCAWITREKGNAHRNRRHRRVCQTPER